MRRVIAAVHQGGSLYVLGGDWIALVTYVTAVTQGADATQRDRERYAKPVVLVAASKYSGFFA
jgi:hypothetical protein